MSSPRRFFLPIVALALVGAAAGFYSRYFEPAPPRPSSDESLVPDAPESRAEVEALDRVFPELSQLFDDPNDWRRLSPNIVVPTNRSVVFLFQNEPIFSPDRTQITLAACTIVFLATDRDLSLAERCRQAIVFESSDRVVLEFTSPLANFGSLDDVKFDFSTFLRGEMKGEVVLRSDMKSPGAEDNVRFQTRDLVFTEKQIRTNFEFSFNLGRNNGAGRGLTIDLNIPLNFAERPKKSAPAATNPDDAFRDRLEALRQDGNLGCGFSIEQIELTELDGYSRFYLDDSFAADDAGNSAASPSQTFENASFIDVRCKKGVYFSSNPESFGGWCVRFNDSVEVVSYRDGAKAEQLLCGSLYFYLQDPEFEKIAQERPDYRQFLNRNAPTGSLARLVPSLVRAQRAPDAPTLVRVDEKQIEISADEIQYDVRRRVLNLYSNAETRESARLRVQNDARVDFSAHAVQIQLDKENKPKSVLASGTGKLDAYLSDGDGTERQIQADWQNGLRVAPEPNQPNQYKLSTQGAVAFYFDGVGTFSAREADFWAQTVEATDDATQNSGSNVSFLTNVVPIAAAFRDDVVFQAARGDAKISDAVVVRFATAPRSNAIDGANANAPNASGAASSAASNGGSFLAGKSTLGDDDGSAFQMQARNLDLWCVLLDDPEKNRVAAVEIERATLRGGVTLVENAFDGTPQMRVAAKEADLVAPGTDDARVVLVGDASTAATFQMRELALSGYNVVVDRAKNAFQVVGPGKLAVRPPAEKAEQTPNSRQVARLFTAEPVEIEWAEAMTFDGNALSFRGSEKHNVLISQRTQTLSCLEARFTLSQPISIFDLDAKATENLAVETIEFFGDFDRPVSINATSFGGETDAPDDEAFYQAFLQNLRYERANERFVATGGGTLRATFKNRDGAQPQIPLVAQTPDAKNAPTNVADADAENWTSVCLKFQNDLEGDVARREILAVGGVRAVACQSPRPLFDLDVDVPTTHPQGAARIAGDEARVLLVDEATAKNAATTPDATTNPLFEIDLRRNVVFRCKDVLGRCDALKYVAAKNLAILSGDGSNKAALYRQAYSGAPRETLGEFSRALYHLDTNRLEVESISASGVAD